MWLKHIILIILFFLLAVLQISFFVHLNLFGVTPSLVFILFFLISFFNNKKDEVVGIAYAIFAGLILSIFSGGYKYFGGFSLILIFMYLLLKKVQNTLSEKKDRYPMLYFLPLFLIWVAVFEIIQNNFIFESTLIFRIIYGLFFAIAGYYIFRSNYVQKV